MHVWQGLGNKELGAKIGPFTPFILNCVSCKICSTLGGVYIHSSQYVLGRTNNNKNNNNLLAISTRLTRKNQFRGEQAKKKGES